MFDFLKNFFLPAQNIEIKNTDEVKSVLNTLIMVLNKNDHRAQASAVKQILYSLEVNDHEKFISKLDSVDMWGGSGAVWEVGYFKSKNEELEFRRAMIKLIEWMKSCGFRSYGANSLYSFFLNEIRNAN